MTWLSNIPGPLSWIVLCLNILYTCAILSLVTEADKKHKDDRVAYNKVAKGLAYKFMLSLLALSMSCAAVRTWGY